MRYDWRCFIAYSQNEEILQLCSRAWYDLFTRHKITHQAKRYHKSWRFLAWYFVHLFIIFPGTKHCFKLRILFLLFLETYGQIVSPALHAGWVCKLPNICQRGLIGEIETKLTPDRQCKFPAWITKELLSCVDYPWLSLKDIKCRKQKENKSCLGKPAFHMREILVAFGTGASVRAECPSIFQEN